jgi:hypothetical protein
MEGVVTAITGATAELLPTLLAIGGIAIAVGAGIFALKKGWGFFKGMAK